ncbi:amidohydrolase family protein [Nesterenkonia muleiensis]|uniref:amidohydrolase family protein n=1 Tax=Nesterenkonia muleiensis TaxID=2282648 RepID=UPI000E72FC67|nr:amidohydrolase family protein [Nesterenkonia muleiensis]
MRTYRGHLFHITGSPSLEDVADHLVSIPDGALVIADQGTIEWIGPFDSLPEVYGSAPLTDTGGFILPGFVDTHIHFPQTYSTQAFGGGQLLEWLDQSIFPAEAQLADDSLADQVASDFVRRRITSGTTAAMVVGSAFPGAQDALFQRSLAAGLRVVSGRGVQTVGPPSAGALLTGEDEAIQLVEEEITRWHAVDTGDHTTALVQVAVVPRFSLSVTPRTLEALGELYAGVRDQGVYFHSHLNENNRPGDGEIAAVLAQYGVSSYLDTYDGKFLPGSAAGGRSLLGRRSIMAHAVHCQDSELSRMAETGTSIAHCPTSQLYLGSGTMPWRRSAAKGVTIALGTDVGAGDEWLIPRVLGDCYKVHLSESGDAGIALGPAELLHTATLAGARALDMEERFGNLDLGKDADFIVVDPQRWEPLAQVIEHGVRSDDAALATQQLLFTLLLGLREPAIAEVYVQGRRVQA